MLVRTTSQLNVVLTYMTVKLIVIFHGSMNSFFPDENWRHFSYLSPNLNCGCLSEAPQWGGSNRHPKLHIQRKGIFCTPLKTPFFLYKMGFNGGRGGMRAECTFKVIYLRERQSIRNNNTERRKKPEYPQNRVAVHVNQRIMQLKVG